MPEPEMGPLFDPLADERDFADRLATELAKHGWGDMHYSNVLEQDPQVLVLLDEWKARRGSA